MKNRLPHQAFAFFAAAAILMALAFVGPRSMASEPTGVTEKDNGKTVKISKGQFLEVVLAGNPTTGFTWEVAKVEKAVLKQVGQPTFKRGKDLVGSGGKVTFRFEAAAPGKTPLQLLYRRPWEKGQPAAKTFELKVTVE